MAHGGPHRIEGAAVRLSVVMSVFNGAGDLPRTLDSILAQTESDFELIVIDDGSTDGTAAILNDYAARDPRIRVITQSNEGLTRALIRGCDAARAPIIARHDCGDVSLPQRFEKQLAAMADDEVVLASCATRWTGPEDELLFIARADGNDVRESLLHAGIDAIRGLPHHGTAMFRRDAYLAAGSYREAFRFAQDLDLWIRLAARGRIAIIDKVLYEARYSIGAISASRRRQQVALAEIAIAIRDGGDERELLERARRVSDAAAPQSKRDAARALYFMASCLRRNGDLRYKQYARAAVGRDPLHLRSWLLLLR